MSSIPANGAMNKTFDMNASIHHISLECNTFIGISLRKRTFRARGTAEGLAFSVPPSYNGGVIRRSGGVHW
jgi:hypothetical protein